MAQVGITIQDLQGLARVGKEEAIETLTALGFPTEELADGTLDVEVTPNRPDALSVEGIARALRAYMGGKPDRYDVGKPSVSVVVDKSVLPVRPAFCGAVVRGIRMDDSLLRSLMQLQEKLHETLGRKRRKVAIGIHDMARVRPPFRYFACGQDGVSFAPLEMGRRMTPGEILRLHEKGLAYAHLVGKLCPMITDSDGEVLSFPPIINGERTRLSEKSQTLFIDCTGTDGAAVRQAASIICAALADRGGKIEGILINGKPCGILAEKRRSIPLAKAETLLGVKIGKSKCAALLSRMGYLVSGSSLFVPGYRTDILDDVDVIEDIAIAHGFNNFEPTLPAAATIGSERPQDLCHEAMVGLGYDEAVTWLLSNGGMAGNAKLPPAPAARIENPLTADFTLFRQAIIPNLLNVLSESKNERLPIRIYEVGPVATPHLGKRLAFASMHPKASFSEIKGAVCALCETLGWEAGFEAAEYGPYAHGRCAKVLINGTGAGFFGEIAPEVLVAFGLEQPCCACEISIE